ncbi:hypothetical protein Tco_1094301 [Tanacetum coccineum]|uniref:Reverse transcriptase domain-containing protein n=1 Tax=Tanacetum coccineum TaxID=301880 RepID=A0ABQ5IHL9_9ASTR
MMTLADKAILPGADNRLPMLEKDMYDSWKSRMELYMMNKQHGRMILESVESGPLIWPTIEDNGVTRPRKYFELSATDAIQADCDVYKSACPSIGAEIVLHDNVEEEEAKIEDIAIDKLIRETFSEIDLIPGAIPVAKSPYRLTPTKMEELSNQLKELQDKSFIRPSSSPWRAPVRIKEKPQENG